MKEKTQSHKGEALQNQAQRDFLDYIHTKQILKLRLKGIDEDDFVFINLHDDIEKRFFKYPTYDAKKSIQYMEKVGAIEVKIMKRPGTGYHMFLYKGLRPGAFRPELVQVDFQKYGYVTQYMRSNLLKVGIKNEVLTNEYFLRFQQHKEKYLELFFKRDEFSGRIHTPITSLPGTIRKELLLDGEEVRSIDVATMQPLILAHILKRNIGKNSFTTWIESGEDIYQKLSEVLKINDRDKGKKRFFEVIFAPPSKELNNIFGNEAWIRWINNYKTKVVPENKYTNKKRHSNLAWLLQKTEVEIMQGVWKNLYTSSIPFLTVHDEIIIKKTDFKASLAIMKSVFDTQFSFYKLNTK